MSNRTNDFGQSMQVPTAALDLAGTAVEGFTDGRTVTLRLSSIALHDQAESIFDKFSAAADYNHVTGLRLDGVMHVQMPQDVFVRRFGVAALRI